MYMYVFILHVDGKSTHPMQNINVKIYVCVSVCLYIGMYVCTHLFISHFIPLPVISAINISISVFLTLILKV